MVSGALGRLAAPFRVKHEEIYSRGAKLQVVENSKMRMFKLDGATNSIINKRSVYTGGYWDYFIPLVYARAHPKVLLIGLGIGTTPYQLHALLGKRVSIDIVEIDREVVGLARKYAPRPIEDRIYIQDGSSFVAGTRKRYDVLMLDAYWKGAKIPKEFLTSRFMGDAYEALSAEGVLAINYAMHPGGILGFGAFRKTLEIFPHVYSMSTDSYGGMKMILCSKKLGKEELTKRISKRFRWNRALRDGYAGMREI